MSEVTNAIQLAIAEEKIYDAIVEGATDDKVEFTFAPTDGVITFSASNINVDTDDSDLLNEVTGTIGASVTLNSKTYKEVSYKVTIDMTGANDNVKVTGEWDN